MSTTLENNIKMAVRDAIRKDGHATIVSALIASIVNEEAGRRVLRVETQRLLVLSEAELADLERKHAGEWLSSKAVLFDLRPRDPVDHGVLVSLGRQLALRYPEQRMERTTRLYGIRPRAIDVEKA